MTLLATSHARQQTLHAAVVLQFEQPRRLSGRFASDSDAPASVNVVCDARHWARVPVTQAGSAATFALDLPTVAEPRSIAIEIRDEDGVFLGEATATVLPKPNGYGLTAARVLDAYDQPLFSAPWMSFDGARLVVTGSHLPPSGDPGQLSVRFAPGVIYDFAYPLPSPEFANHFWYWPNADLSNFQITIDLPASAAGSDPFAFEFVDPADTRSPDVTGTALRFGRKVYIPPRLDSAICFPRDANQLTRVQTWSNDQSVTFTGYSAFRTMEALFAHYGLRDAPGIAILDWGCGHGRVTRHFIQNWPYGRIAGADVDRQNVEWCSAHLKGHFLVLPLHPPSSIPDASFDGIFGISVMTHLTAETQDAWLKEIARILRPGGIALITSSGFAAAAFSSVFRSTEWWETWVRTGFDDAQLDPALDGKIPDGAYYRNTLQTPDYTRKAWVGHLELIEIHPSAIGYQDVAVLRRRDGGTRTAP